MTVPEIPDFDPGLVVHAAVPDTLKGLYDLERIDRRESYDRLYYELNRIHDLGSADDREESFHVTYPEGSRRSALVYNLKIENEWHHRVIVNDDSRGSDETKRVIDVFDMLVPANHRALGVSACRLELDPLSAPYLPEWFGPLLVAHDDKLYIRTGKKYHKPLPRTQSDRYDLDRDIVYKRMLLDSYTDALAELGKVSLEDGVRLDRD